MYDSFPVCRTILSNWIYKDPEYLKVWITMLSMARYLKEPKEGIYEKIIYKVNYGEFIFGYKSWSENTGISYQRLRGLIKKMITSEMIILKTRTTKFTIYEITNYLKYNSLVPLENEQVQGDTNSRVTVRQQSGNSQVTTNKEGKEGKTIFLSDSIEYRLADFLRKWIRKNNPNARVPDDDKLNNWCSHIDKMIRIDKRNSDEIKKIIEFAQKDSFWCKNILSTEKLRKQYDQLTLKMKGATVVPNQANKGSNTKTNISNAGAYKELE